MQTTRISRVPPGSQDLLFHDARLRRRVQSAWFARAEESGYAEVIPPTFEYEEVFTRSAGSELAARLIRFLDRDGALVALRADFTSAIARVVASRFADQTGPLRLCYAGKVYRQESDGGGRTREAFQLGGELIGDARASADVEILRLAIGLLRDIGVHDFQINLGAIGFVRPLLDVVAADQVHELRRAIDHKDAAALARFASGIAIPVARRALTELPALSGRRDVLDRARELAWTPEASESLSRLREIDEMLTPEERGHVVYDLGEVRGLGYYTGIEFEVFVGGIGRAVGFGGRYDGLLALYGADRPAVGFALETDLLAPLLPKDGR